MKMPTTQQFNCLVTNEPNHTYFGCPGWRVLTTAYKMEAGERSMFYLDYYIDEIMVYYEPTSNDDGSLTPDFDPEPARRKV